MSRLPDRSNLDHLKKQAKDLIHRYRDRDPEAIAQFRHALPAAADRSDDEIASLGLRLHDAQSCVARDYGFASWADLKRYVEAQSAARTDRAGRVVHWLRLVYSGDVDGTFNRAHPHLAVRMLAENPDLPAGNPYLACAIGDEGALRQATAADPAWVDRPGGPFKLPPLVRDHAFEPAAGAGISRAAARQRAVSARRRRRSQPAHRQSLAARIPGPARRRAPVVGALWRRRQQPRSAS